MKKEAIKQGILLTIQIKGPRADNPPGKSLVSGTIRAACGKDKPFLTLKEIVELVNESGGGTYLWRVESKVAIPTETTTPTD